MFILSKKHEKPSKEDFIFRALARKASEFVKVFNKDTSLVQYNFNYHDDLKKMLWLLIKDGRRRIHDEPKSEKDVMDNLGYAELVSNIAELITPRELMQMFPIDKEYDGEKYQTKDYYYTIDVINKLNMDDVLKDQISIFELFLNYQNIDISMFAVFWMETVSKANILQGGKDILVEFMEENGFSSVTYHKKEGYIQDSRTGKVFKVQKPKKRLPKFMKLLKN